MSDLGFTRWARAEGHFDSEDEEKDEAAAMKDGHENKTVEHERGVDSHDAVNTSTKDALHGFGRLYIFE